jgi:hypothetical protein
MSKIIGVNFKNKETGEYGGRTYNYFCTLPVVVGDIVSAPTQKGDAVVRVSEVNVPESKIEDRVLAILKTINSFAEETED